MSSLIETPANRNSQSPSVREIPQPQVESVPVIPVVVIDFLREFRAKKLAQHAKQFAQDERSGVMLTNDIEVGE